MQIVLDIKGAADYSFADMKKVKAVIFDWGGVLIDNPTPGMFAHFAAEFGVTVGEYAKAHAKFIEKFERGAITEDCFWEKVCGELKVEAPKETSLWARVFAGVYSTKIEMVELAGSLHNAGYKTALLSNTELPSMRYFQRLKLDIFDAVVLSCVEGTRKPEQRIYELTLERLGCKPKETVFIDDRLDYLEGAKEVGLNTIIFENIEQVKEELVKLSVVWRERKL